MKIFEEMKAALEAQAPIGDETEKVQPTPTLFQIGDKVSYRTPVIKTPTDYSWSWHHGTIQEISEHLELVIIIPRDTPQQLISIPFVYVRAYEKNEIMKG